MEMTEKMAGSRHHPMFIGLLCLAILQVCDVLTTQHLIGVLGNEAEANPFVAFFVERGWLWQLKLAVFSFVSAMFWHYRDRNSSLRCVKILIVFYLLVVAWNMTGMIQLL